MSVTFEDIEYKISLFHPYLKKYIVIEKLTALNKFSNFNAIYSSLRNDDDDVSQTIAKTLSYGLEHKIIDSYELDELLFLIMEDSLFNSYIYHIETDHLPMSDKESIVKLLSSWEIPEQHKILSNIDVKTNKDFILSGYRIFDNENTVDSIRLLLLDNKIIKTYAKNEDPKEIVFPTIVELDFRRKLLHIRLRDVDNIISDSPTISTMSGRIQNTLKFIETFNPKISYTKIENFKSSLYNLEEYLLSVKRNSAMEKLEEFNSEIDEFTNKVCNKFNPPSTHEISPRKYIDTGVLSIIATTLVGNELGDVVGIRFKDTQNDDKKYAEITIRDSGNKCISTSNLYWLNLSVLQTTSSIEFLKVITKLDAGIAIVNLEFSLDTANIRLLQRNAYDGEDSIKPSQEKYDDFIEYLKPYLN